MNDTNIDEQIDEIIDKYRKDIFVAANGFNTDVRDSAVNVAAYSSVLVKDAIKKLIAKAVVEARLIDMKYLLGLRTDDINVVAKEIQNLIAELQQLNTDKE